MPQPPPKKNHLQQGTRSQRPQHRMSWQQVTPRRQHQDDTAAGHTEVAAPEPAAEAQDQVASATSEEPAAEMSLRPGIIIRTAAVADDGYGILGQPPQAAPCNRATM
jgi:hypothetical protein